MTLPLLNRPATQATILLATGLWAVLFAHTLVTGTSAQWFEHLRDVAQYTAALRAQSSALRTQLALDFLFLATYSIGNVAILQHLAQRTGWSLGHTIMLVLGLGAAGLDVLEDIRILAQLEVVEHGGPLSLGDLFAQQQLSHTKWMVGHLALVWLGLLLWAETWYDRAFSWALIGVQLAIGMAVYVVNDENWRALLIRSRALNLGFGFAYLAWYMGRLPEAD